MKETITFKSGPFFSGKKNHKQSGHDLKMEHFSVRETEDHWEKTIGPDVIADALFPWVVLHHHDELGLLFVNHVL